MGYWATANFYTWSHSSHGCQSHGFVFLTSENFRPYNIPGTKSIERIIADLICTLLNISHFEISTLKNDIIMLSSDYTQLDGVSAQFRHFHRNYTGHMPIAYIHIFFSTVDLFLHNFLGISETGIILGCDHASQV